MNLLTIKELNKADILKIIDTGLKIKISPEKFLTALKGKVMAMLFQKTSTRTRISFEVGMYQLGGYALYLDWRQTNLTLGDLRDEIKCVARYCDIIMARVFSQKDLEIIANSVNIPIINGLSDSHHPCQILSDLMTIKEKFRKLQNIKIAYVGDGNNVCNSLILGCSKLGISIAVATPKGYEPNKEVISEGVKNSVLRLTNQPNSAVKDADVIYTDTWVSMGQENERGKRIKIFKPYQVNEKLIGNSNALVMHCLPAHRSYEITDEVIDSRNSIVFDQAENRLHCQKAILLWAMGKI
jgi:ornithine carbamoyltransferase